MRNNENFETADNEPLLAIVDKFLALQTRVSNKGTDAEFVAFDDSKNRIEKTMSAEFDLRTVLRGSSSWHKFLGSSLPGDAPELLSINDEHRVLQKIVSEILTEQPTLSADLN